mgnify:CR=1 FL=1
MCCYLLKLWWKYEKIVLDIEQTGFKNAALINSVSDTSSNGGFIGWVKEDNLNKSIKNQLSKDQVLCKRLPHNKYQYQVHLKKDAQLILNESQVSALWEFLERNVDHCLVTNYNIIDYLERKSPYCFGGYFYVKDEKFLSPIYMLAQQAIDKVIQFRKVKNGSNKKTKR